MAFFIIMIIPPPLYLINNNYITINFPTDQYKNQNINVLKEIIDICIYFADKNYYIVFVPHIFIDMDFINKVLKNAPHYISRNFIKVAPMIQGDIGTNYLCSIYKYSKLNIVGRLHANIASIVSGIPTIGLNVINDRVKSIYQSIDSDSSCVELEENFSKKIINYNNCINYKKIKELKEDTMNKYQLFFKNNGFI